MLVLVWVVVPSMVKSAVEGRGALAGRGNGTTRLDVDSGYTGAQISRLAW